MILRDDTDCFLLARTLCFLGNFRAEEAETIDLYEALSWIKSIGLEYVVVEMDAKLVMDVVNKGEQDESIFGCYVSPCNELFGSFNSLSIHFMYCTVNEVTHSFARASISYLSLHVWVESPTFVEDLLDEICFTCNK
ncbi:hypothetical protein ACS0TY_022801 [Phlomoides rotata]